MNKQINLSTNLKKLSEIAAWFDEQQTVDVEEGLLKVKEAAALIKESRSRLKAIENEFAEIKKDIDEDQTEEQESPKMTVTQKEPVRTKKVTIEEDDIPF